MPAATINTHLDLTRRRARRLCADAARPHEVRLSTITSAAGVLFAASVVGGYMLRAWWMAG